MAVGRKGRVERTERGHGGGLQDSCERDGGGAGRAGRPAGTAGRPVRRSRPGG
ncbi:hypothetical protein KCH_50960 [Kitasatospora cheerisanensis KCTC 2395]|uniref:Uncharacterized protein n=1 Tax=Kitasatospora cheerisanensis KCTC 2395 TaxID=1348663 RepID=A0A066YUF0_9ACTN|nr:hypothetical protein KCH_50960 [Kitasatospora cheerisanensis KCTC 2395]